MPTQKTVQKKTKTSAPLRVMTLNVNGIRSAFRKGLGEFLREQNPDIVCLQEIKAEKDDLSSEMTEIPGYFSYFFSAQKKGYSGVAVYSKKEPLRVRYGYGSNFFDAEGRVLELEFKNLLLFGTYFPSGTSGEERQSAKYTFLDEMYTYLSERKKENKEILLCGDVNIAHTEKDLKNWKSNQKNSGFLPEERAWLTKFLNAGFVDVHRSLEPEKEVYTWWSNRGQAYAKDVGWRIDYQIASEEMASKALTAEVFREPKFSDHAPLRVDYAFDLL